MFGYLLTMYNTGRITKDDLKKYVPIFLTNEQYKEITGEAY